MSRPAFSFCVCPDGQLVREHLQGLFASHGLENADWERHTFWGDEELPPLFWEHLTLQGLFQQSKVLVVRNAQNIPAEKWRGLSQALSRPNPSVWPFFCLEVPWEKGSPKIPAHLLKLRCFAFAEQQKWVWRSAGLDPRSVRTYVQQRASAHGLRFEPGALEAVLASVPVDAAAIEQEIAKIALLAEDGLVRANLDALTRQSPEYNAFAFVQMLESANLSGVWKELACNQEDLDTRIFPLIGLLLREARILWQIRAGEGARLAPRDVKSKEQLASSLGFTGISALFQALLRAEYGIKTGERQPAQALEALVAELGLLFQTASVRRARA